jgi:hypothetical protein
MEFKTRLNANLIAEEIIDRLIINNDNDWNDNKTRASEKHELTKSRFKNHNTRSENINIQIKYGINIYKRKMEGEKIFKESENFLYIILDQMNE